MGTGDCQRLKYFFSHVIVLQVVLKNESKHVLLHLASSNQASSVHHLACKDVLQEFVETRPNKTQYWHPILAPNIGNHFFVYALHGGDFSSTI